MKLLLPLLLAPTLALAAATGSVTLLDGTPLAGAVIKSLTDSVTTTANGSFALGRATGISSRSARSISVTSHLSVENGRPRLSFAGMDIAGRSRSAATARQNPSSYSPAFSARSTSAPDTLKVYWKGKRLTVLPVNTDTTVTFRIDTAWKDDAGIPWNPSITYGSLFDSRDGQTYRTVTIGSQTWMAENLNYASSATKIGVCYNNSADSCRKYGRMYTWPDVMNGSNSNWKSPSGATGICPTGWFVPSVEDWGGMATAIGGIDTAAARLKAINGWAYSRNGKDDVGFRALPANRLYEGNYGNAGEFGFWWSTSELDSSTACYRYIFYGLPDLSSWIYSKSVTISLRCFK